MPSSLCVELIYAVCGATAARLYRVATACPSSQERSGFLLAKAELMRGSEPNVAVPKVYILIFRHTCRTLCLFIKYLLCVYYIILHDF